jgi:hypothetical protein
MPTYDKDILEAALIGYEQQTKGIDAKIKQLREHLGGHVAQQETVVKRVMSAATRKRMAAAQQKRRAAKNADATGAARESEITKTKKGKRAPLSAEARERIAAAQRKRWAKAKKAAK